MQQPHPEQEPWRQPLTGPVEDTGAPMPVIRPASPSGPIQDTPDWQPPLPVGGQAGSNLPQHSTAHLPVPASAQTPASRSFNGLFSTIKRDGRWEVPAVLNLSHGLSDVKLDFRDAVVTTPVVQVNIYSLMSETKLIVPPGVGVEFADGASVLSEDSGKYEAQPAPGGYKLTIAHYGLMSSVKVQTLAPGQDPPKWWRRS